MHLFNDLQDKGRSSFKKKINNYRSRPSFKYYKISKFEENMDFRYIPTEKSKNQKLEKSIKGAQRFGLISYTSLPLEFYTFIVLCVDIFIIYEECAYYNIIN